MKKKLTIEQMEELRLYYKLSNEYSTEVKQEFFFSILDQRHIDTQINFRELAKRFDISKATAYRIVNDYINVSKRRYDV